jgi:PKD repeat protein
MTRAPSRPGRPERQSTRAGSVLRGAACLVVALSVSACQVRKADAPPLAGPSELGTSITVQATPDVLNQDGASQALVAVQARDADGRPIRDLILRLEILVGGVLADFGLLSARTVVTGADGRATATYTAPPPPPESVDTLTIVTVMATPIGSNFANAVPRSVNIRLVPPGIILPPNGTPVPRFTYSPQPVEEGTPVEFDASTSLDDGTIVAYQWDFGDGNTGTGVRRTHTFARSGTFNVTLTVRDDRNLQASTTQAVSVQSTSNPSASFTRSPASPAVGEDVFFNGSASTAAPGRRIVSHNWTFGDGSTGSGQLTTHAYGAVGSYTATLTVTDDIGKSGTASALVTVVEVTRPIAVFVFSPASPTVNVPVNFDATQSTAPSGRTITSYEWTFGDGTTGTGVLTTHAYSQPASYAVVLKVTDSSGVTGTSTRTVVVSTGTNPTAEFTFSPDPGTAGSPMFFDASASSASGGATIVSYRWNFGDGTVVTGGRTITHAFAAAGTYSVTLTVTDSAGLQGTVSKAVIVDP